MSPPTPTIPTPTASSQGSKSANRRR
jgi:hypothetical protein